MLSVVAPYHYVLSGQLTLQDGASMARALFSQLDTVAPTATDTVYLDVRALVRADSALLAVLLGAARRAQTRGFCLQVQGLSAELHGLAQVYGVDSLISPLVIAATE